MNIPVKPNDVTWTDDQWKAIHASGQDILVAAAAGSGKTAVLVERIIQKIVDESDPINVDELLVATFTNASAAEMRHRIGIALEKEIEKKPHSYHLRKQLQLLNNASISTLHSFCLNVVRKYYYMIDIDPGFRIADETEGQLLMDDALEVLLEEEYGTDNNEEFFRVVDIFTGDRTDTQLQKLILNLYNFSRSNPDPDAWLEDVVNVYDVSEIKQVDDLPYIMPLLFDIKLKLEESRRLFTEALELTKAPGGPYNRADNFLDDLNIVNRLLSANEDSFQNLYDNFQTYKFTTLKTAKGDEFDKDLVDHSTKLRNKGKEIIQKLKDELFSRKPETYLRDLAEMEKPIAKLVDLVRKFSGLFEDMKREKGLVDFNDLEHFALKVLGKKDKENDEVLIPTEAALAYRSKFKEVFVDEYQDTNMVQETILQLIKEPEESSGNLFMVGDVKQSIYRFRLAEPNLFLGKYLRFNKTGNESGLRIDLSQNFRSRKEVLQGTNYLFKQIMGVQVGEIEYDEDAELKLGAQYPENQEYPIELAILHKGNEENEDNTDSESEDQDQDFFSKEELEQSQLESRYVAKKIRELIESDKQVFDTKAKSYRNIQYKDIVILLRSFTWAPQFMEEFKEQGIPVYANISSGYFEAAEVAVMVALLQTIDNPYQDIPLAAVLRSPIIGTTEEELAIIRVYAKKVSFFEAVKNFQNHAPKSESEEKLQKKLGSFLEQLNKWRSLARQGALSELIWQLYRDTKFYDYVGGLPGGKQRQANLRALYDRARQYESTSFRGLFRFLRFIERMKSRGEDLGVARALGEQEDVVRIMTIHSSKGLEFPVVFVAGLRRQFNMMDLRKSYLFDKEYGFATNYINPEKQISYPSLFVMSVKRKKLLELVAEEMRVLYVALTRAKEKLYLVGSTNHFEKLIDKWQKHLTESEWLLPDYDRMTSMNYLDWIGPALIRHRNGNILRKSELGISTKSFQEVSQHPSLWKIVIMNEDDFLALEEEKAEEKNMLQEFVRNEKSVPVISNYKEKVQNQLNWLYPYQHSTVHRSKQSVSEIKRLREVRDAESGEDIIRTFKKPIADRPKFMKEKQMTAAEIGTAMHMVMQHVDLSETPTFEKVKSQIASMRLQELLTEEEENHIDIANIVGFFETTIGQRLLKADWIKRELPFSFALSSKEIYPNWQGEDEPVFIQGIIDCLFKDENGLVLLDYKTDRITGRFPKGFEQAKPILYKRYETQIDLYKRAIQSILNDRLEAAYLYFFDGGYLMEIRD